MRVLAPAVLVVTAYFVGGAEWLGIRAALPSYLVACGLLFLLAVITVVIALRRVPETWSNAVSTFVWCMPVGATLVSEYSLGNTDLALMLLVEVASAGVLLNTRMVVASLVVVFAFAIPLLVRDTGTHAAMFISALFTSGLFALLIHILMRRALVTAETHRLAEADTADKLARQLEELEQSRDERSRLQDQLLHAQRLEATGTLAAGLAHDMNNVLASITSFAELVLEDAAPASQPDVRQIMAQASRGAELTRGLLAFSRRGQYRKQVTRIDDVVRDVIPILSRTLAKSIELRTDLGALEMCIDGDPAQLGQVIVNLAVNAADAMNGKGVLDIRSDSVTLDKTTASALDLEPGRHIRICVRDNGIGMDDATRLRIFEPFFTTKPLGGGTGLGLSIVWGIVKSHQGSVRVESKLGCGTTFWIHLPITNAAPIVVTSLPVPTTSKIGPVTVLVIDDEPAVRDGTARLLERRGFQVLRAADGAEGLRLFDLHGPAIALVVLDMGMPLMGGAECFSRIRARSTVPILIATGYAVDAEAQALVAQGASLIEKPFSRAMLLGEVSRLLGRADLMSA